MLAILGMVAYAQKAGSLDDTWNHTGIKIYDVLPNESDNALAVAEQPDGKILVAGGINDNGDIEGYVARFLPDGTFDSTFHYDGIVTIDMSNENWDMFLDLKIRPDGKILALAETEDGGDRDIMLVQFMPDGSLDPNFGSLGVVRKDLGDGADDESKGLLLYPDGRFLVYGNNTGGTSSEYAYVVRFNANGTVDNNFGIGGVYKWDQTSAAEFMDGVLLPNGKMVFAGYEDANGEARATLIGLTVTGDSDPSFGINGKLSPALTSGQDDIFTTLALNEDNTKLIAGGITDGSGSVNLLIARFSISGGGDPQFGNGGFVEMDLSIGGDESLESMVVQPDGKMLLAGSIEGSHSYIARLNTDGQLDLDFNDIGYWMQDISPANEEGMSSLLIDHNGKVVGCGTMEKAGNLSPYLVRLNGDISTGIGMIKTAEQTLAVYPNPAHEAVTISLGQPGQYHYQILDMRGAMVAEGKVSAQSTDKVVLPTSDWVPGSYLVRLTGGDQLQTAILVKQ